MTPTSNAERQQLLPGIILGVTSGIPLLGIGLPLVAVTSAALSPIRSSVRLPRVYWWVVWLSALALLCFFVSAALNRVAISYSSIGQLGVFLVVLLGARSLLNRPDAIAVALTCFGGAMVGYYLVARPANTIGSFENLWKYGIGYPVALLVVGFIVFRGLHRAFSVVALLALAFVGAVADFRSYALICCIAAVLTVLPAARNPRAVARRAVVVGISVVGTVVFLLSLVQRGVFGAEVAARSASQFGDGPLGILLGGRTEPPLAIAAIMQRPFVGWGNEQSLTQQVVSHGLALAKSLGVHDPAAALPLWIRAGGRVSLHSVLLTSWVEGGIAAALVFVVIILIFVRVVLRPPSRYKALAALIAVQSIWDLLFSPWADNRGVLLGLAVLFVIANSMKSDGGSAEPEPSVKPTTKRMREFA